LLRPFLLLHVNRYAGAELPRAGEPPALHLKGIKAAWRQSAPFLRRLLIHATDAGGGAVCVRDAAAGTAPWSEELRAAVEARGAVEAAVKATPQSRAKPRQPALA
jgi:hypothetical protein